MKIKYLNRIFTVIFVSANFLSTAQIGGESVTFQIKNAGITVDGAFEKFTSHVSYNSSNPKSAVFKGTIDVASINTGVNLRDEHLAKEEYFHTASFPKIEFISSTVVPLKDKTIKVSGFLTIKGIKKPVEISVREVSENGIKFLIGNLEIDRRDFGVGENSWIMGDEVKISIKVFSAT